MLQNAYFLAKIGADTAENEQHFAEILPIGRRVAELLADISKAQDDEVGDGTTSVVPESGRLRPTGAAS